jgi:hypothetical protein
MCPRISAGGFSGYAMRPIANDLARWLGADEQIRANAGNE